jgi:hypothetical protein
MKNKASLFRYLYNRRAGDREHDALLAHYKHTRAHTHLSSETVFKTYYKKLTFRLRQRQGHS